MALKTIRGDDFDTETETRSLPHDPPPRTHPDTHERDVWGT